MSLTPVTRLLTAISAFTLSAQAYADIFAVFRNPDGSTKWQYVANTSASILIITLLIVLTFLFRAHIRAVRSNRALTDMKATLEERVAQRTAVLQETTEELQNREAYIAGIVDSMPAMLIGLNQQLEITQWNSMAESITGRPIADVLGLNLWKAYAAITLTPEQVKGVLDSKQTLTLKHHQRGQYSFDITVYALTGQNETGIVILVSDVTKQVNAENKLAERDKISSMGELASAMAYDISLPLQTISSSLLTAQHQLSDAELPGIKNALASALKMALQSGKQASAIVQNLLDLARSHRDEKQPAQIQQIMDRSIDLAKTLFADANGLRFSQISINRHYDTSLPAISCYPAELAQVFVRLLRSAFYALNTTAPDEQHQPVIDIEIGEFYETLWIKLQHNGKCLTAEEQLDIFQPYFSLTTHSLTYPAEQRLSYTYFIITDHHRGQMAVTSNESHGTSFHIQLPMV
jgi:PAS domain S-box-containing protein